LFSYKQVVHMLMLLGLIRITSLSDADGARLKRRNTQPLMLAPTHKLLESIWGGGWRPVLFLIYGAEDRAHRQNKNDPAPL